MGWEQNPQLKAETFLHFPSSRHIEMPLNSQIEESIQITGLTDNSIGRKAELEGVFKCFFFFLHKVLHFLKRGPLQDCYAASAL